MIAALLELMPTGDLRHYAAEADRALHGDAGATSREDLRVLVNTLRDEIRRRETESAREAPRAVGQTGGMMTCET